MATATLTSKGQITLPKNVRDGLGLKTGNRIEFSESDREFVIVPATRNIRTLKGLIAKPKKPVSVEDMNSTVGKRSSTRR